jgi:arabinogalactan oligomer / maltooligosaccharide transport system permease protein
MGAVTTTAPVARRWRRLLPRLDTRTAVLYLLPAVLVMGAITFYPLFFQVYISFTEFGLPNTQPGAPPADFVGLDYQRIVEGRLGIPNFDFFRIIGFNLWWALSNVVIHVVVGVGIAILLNTRGLRFKGFYRALFILPVVIPPLIVATVWRNMFDRNNGAINELLILIGGLFKIPPEAFQIDWLRQVADPIPLLPLPLAYFALLAANTWMGWPLNSVVATGALQSIPRELYEAAEMDGAGAWQKFRNVTLVFLRPAMIPYAIYGFVITFNLFYLTYFMSAGGPFGRTELLVTQAFRLVYEYRLYGIAAAFGVFMFFILLAITVFFNRLTRATASYDT